MTKMISSCMLLALRENVAAMDVSNNPLCAECFLGSIKIYLHFISFPNIEMVQVIELLMTWQCKEPGY